MDYSFSVRYRLSQLRHSPRSAVKVQRGNNADYIKRHNEDVKRAMTLSSQARTLLLADLFNRIADDRTLRYAWHRLSIYGGTSPGPNHITYDDIHEPDLSNLLRELTVTIREERYAPGPCRQASISKGLGRGYRTLDIINIEDRVVGKAIQLIIQPVLEHFFLSCSFGFRRGLNREDALCEALRLKQQDQRTYWVAEDIRNAFPSIPRNRLIDIVAHYLPEPKLINLIRRCVQTDHQRHGLSQGGALSPSLMNIYLHHFFDRCWRDRYPDIPIIRYVDDLLMLCRNSEEAQRAFDGISELLAPANMRLKYTLEEAMHDLRVDPLDDWLGYQVAYQQESPQRFQIGCSSKALVNLEMRLKHCHSTPFAPLQEIPSRADMLERWNKANKRWNRRFSHQSC